MPSSPDFFGKVQSVNFVGRARNFVGYSLGHAKVLALPGPNGCLLIRDLYDVDASADDTFLDIKDISQGGLPASFLYRMGQFYSTIHPF